MRRYRLPVWWFLWILASFLRLIFCRLRIEGAQNVPLSGGGVVACNHNPGLDFIFLGYASPREIYYMAKEEAFQINPLASALMRGGGVFPVQRGKSDKVAFGNALEIIRQGILIGMFPEGTRSRDGKLQRARTGTARLALEAGVPVIPAAVIGSPAVMHRFRQLRRPLVIVRFGAPIRGQMADDPVEAAKAFTDEIMLAIADLLPPEQRGVYADGVPEA